MNEELVWLIRRSLEPDENALLAGGPWLPNSWLDEAGIRQNLNVLAGKNGAYLTEYGHPFGYLPLREHLALMLAGLGITADPGQILLTHGTSQALELVIRYLLTLSGWCGRLKSILSGPSATPAAMPAHAPFPAIA
jgi:DNA-binding transcriptional MocR family regulator